MKLIALMVFVFMLNSPGNYCQWEHIATIGNNDLKAVKFFNEHTGIVAGQGGIWRSTNGGVNWLQVLSGQNLNALSFPDNNIGYSVGDSGKIYKSTNGGLNWNQIGFGVTSKKLNTVSFPLANTGWIMGESGKILYTFNGGNSFIPQTSNDTLNDINYLQMINSSTGYFCGSSTSETFGFSPNGGINWLYTLNVPGNILNSVSHIPTSTSSILAVGTNGRIRKTTTNGTIWTIVTSPVNISLNHILFIDINTGYIVGNSGVILKTTSNGLNWVIDAVVTTSNFKSIYFINPTIAWIVGSNGVVVRTGIPVGIVQNGNAASKEFRLYQNYPNPFNPSTSISFELTKNSFVKLTVYDPLGNEIKRLIDNETGIGKHQVYFYGDNLSSGVYLYKLEANNEFTEYKKMILIK